MKRTLVLLLVAVGCASTYRDVEPPQDGKQGKPPRPMWKHGDHPAGKLAIGGGLGEFDYKTRGTVSNARTDADAARYHVTLEWPWFGVQAEGIKTDPDLRGFVEAETFDVFVYGQMPLWPNRRLRFVARPGMYYNAVNLIGAGPTDVEPDSVGFRLEAEAEFDAIKKPNFVLSVYIVGRADSGYADAKVGGIEESADAWGWGVETGVRAQWRRFFASLAWVERTQEFEGTRRFLEATYGYSGLMAFIGFRW